MSVSIMELRVNVKGESKLEDELNKRFSSSALEKIVDKALTAGARVIKRELEKSFESFKDTGASQDEITISKPMTLDGVRTVVIYWSGPHKRYTIIHLNEFGTVKNPNPRGKGAVERAIRAGRAEYLRVVRQEIGGAM